MFRVRNLSTKYFISCQLTNVREALRLMIPDGLVQILPKVSIITARDGDELHPTICVSDFYLPDLSASGSSDTPLYYIHSSFLAPSDSVFFGPDTYLFVSFLHNVTRHVSQAPQSIVDVCCGSGAGAIHMARTYPQAKVAGLDLNARLAATTVHFQESNLYASIPEDWKSTGIDFIVSNPPYIVSTPSGWDLPIYADDDAEFELDISLQIVEE
jgi:SAM-dependent methyltransferase